MKEMVILSHQWLHINLSNDYILDFYSVKQKDMTVSRRNSRNFGRKSVVAAASTSSVLPQRCVSPQNHAGQPGLMSFSSIQIEVSTQVVFFVFVLILIWEI